MNYELFVSCPKGMEYLLEEELRALQLQVTRVSPQGVYGSASLSIIYHLCLWSRLANRVQLILFSGDAPNQEALYQLCHAFAWETVFLADKTLSVEFHGSSPMIRNTLFGAQVVKDGVVDQCRLKQGMRPVVARDAPQIRLHAYLKNDVITVSFDLTGYSLHQRGYRLQAGLAPLKENTAAAVLIRANWPLLSEEGYTLLDPCCGAGTLVIEAAMMAGQRAPGLFRDDQSFQHWVLHQPEGWEQAKTEARALAKPLPFRLQGRDNDPMMVASASENAERAGVAHLVEFYISDLTASVPSAKQGLVVCNPPYGERLGDPTALVPLYQALGHVLHTRFQGWQVALLTANSLLAKATGLRARKQYTLFNGPLECKLYTMSLDATNQLKSTEREQLSDAAHMLLNRLQKNHAHLQKWAKREQISCYRLYDADLPEYAYAIDLYNDKVVLQEYAAPAEIALHKVEKRSLEVRQVVSIVLGLNSQELIIKERKQQKGSSQYQKMDQKNQTMVVREGRAQLIVNLHDYLDTGLFLDHRRLRLRFAALPPKTRFLNCFSYTGTASVHAALSGAMTTNVDLSKTYLTWAEDNFKLNGLALSNHQFVQDDCTTWLKKTRDRFDVIFLDPPSFSNSKRMGDSLDLKRDHDPLIRSAMALLYPGGVLYFSTNSRQFKLSPAVMSDYTVRDISVETIDLDFKRNKRIHQCFVITAESVCIEGVGS